MKYSLLSDIAKEFDIPVSTLRYYEKEGALPFLRRNSSGYFLIDDADLTALYLLRALRDAGCSVKSITEVMKIAHQAKLCEQNSKDFDAFFPAVIQILSQHTDELLEKQQELLWQLQVTNYLRWKFFKYLQSGTSKFEEPTYPGPLPPSFLQNVPQFSYDVLLNAYLEKYSAPSNRNPMPEVKP